MNEKFKVTLTCVLGAFIGFVNGIFGGGGGMLVVPMLSLFYGLSPKKSHATAMAVILPISIVSLVAHLIFNKVQYATIFIVLPGFLVGGIVGTLLLKKIKAKWLVKIFAFVILAAGVKMLFF